MTPASQPIELAPGALHLPSFLDETRQLELIEAARGWARGPVGMTQHRTRGGVMSVQMCSLGWYWDPRGYHATTPSGEVPLPVPVWLQELGREVLAAAALPEPSYIPDVALVNWYAPEARMGMHQDRDEACLAPVVSLSIGDTGVFRLGNPETRNRPWQDVELRSGDALVLGGASRLAYHGVVRILPGTGPGLGLPAGRLNLTLRVSGL